MQIEFLFNFYAKKLDEELEAFMLAFQRANNLMPDETTRCHIQKKELTDEEGVLITMVDKRTNYAKEIT